MTKKLLFTLSLLGLLAAGCGTCVKSHTETQYKSPPSVVVGGGKYGGGIALPLGNAKPVQVEVCDEYAK